MPSFLARLQRPVRGLFLLRRVLVELRGIRRALERQADALELQAGGAHQALRSFSRSREESSEQDLRGLTEVAYVDNARLGQVLAKEDELRSLLGRDPTELELERAYLGEVE